MTLSNAERNFTRTQTTNDEGGYTFSFVPPGAYRLEAEATGFKKSVITSLNALVDTPQDFNVTMEVGAVTESVDVSAGVEAPLNTTDATIGTTFESRRVEELPLNARNDVKLNTHIAKFDLNITDNRTMFLRGNYQDARCGTPRRTT